MLAVLALGWTAWVIGRVTRWRFEMGSNAKELRRECLRKGWELEKGGSTHGRDQLEALVREILKEGMVGEGQKDVETLDSERMIIDSIIKRIRC